MNVSDWQHEENRKEATRLRALGFEFEVTGDGYSVRFQGQWLGGASVRLPRTKPLHWRHRAANLRDNLVSALSIARRHLASHTSI